MSLDTAIEAAAARRPLLIGVDFDGTLAPIVPRPDQARPDRQAMPILASLAERADIDVAVVSGRVRDDLRRMVGDLPGVILVGEHGNDMGDDPPPAPGIARLDDKLTEIAQSLPGAAVEVKRTSVVFHYRNADGESASRVLPKVYAVADEVPGTMVMEGKKVLEIMLAGRTKGDAIGELAADAKAIIYIGDDTTDESVFSMLGPDDVGVKVGEGATRAHFRVDDVEGVVGILTRLLQAVEEEENSSEGGGP